MNEKPFQLYQLLLAVLVVLAITLPYADKAFHIDDPFVLGIAGQILENPADPFGGTFDWFGSLQPIWQTTSNPPLVSYYLALFIQEYGVNEAVLHIAMILFYLLLAWGIVYLSYRFAQGSLIPLLFLMFSPAIMVSGNVMRDIPAAGLAVAGISLFIIGTDRNSRFFLLGGSILAGLAVLAKYSAASALPVMVLYPFFKRKWGKMFWILPALLIVGAWHFHNITYYGQSHMAYLLQQREGGSAISWMDKTCGAAVIFGSMIYLLPALFFSECRRKRWISLSGLVPVGIATYWGVERFFNWEADIQYLVWAILGALTLYLAVFEALRRGGKYLKKWGDEVAGDSLFLLAWLCAPLLFSILFAPFQAVRHQILALPPFLLLLWRAVYLGKPDKRKGINFCVFLLFVLQTGMGYLVTTADYQLADTYRMMAAHAKEKFTSDEYQTWFVGHWGWKFYAEKAGFKMRHRGGALPQPGDIVLWPLRTHYGDVWDDLKRNNAFQILSPITVDKVTYTTDIPIRTMNFHGAAFYALIGKNVPYRLFDDIDLETLKVYRVKDYDPEKVLKQ